MLFDGMTEKRSQGHIERLDDFECGLCVVCCVLCCCVEFWMKEAHRTQHTAHMNFLVNYCRYSLYGYTVCTLHIT